MDKKQKLIQDIKSGKIKSDKDLLTFVIAEKQKSELIKEIIPQIKLPDTLKGDKGDPGIPGEPGKDGVDGKPGRNGRDGRNPDVATVVQEAVAALEDKIPTLPQIVEKLPENGQAVRDSLEMLTGEERLDKSAIRGLDEIVKGGVEKYGRPLFGGGSTARMLYQLQDVHITNPITNGDNLVYNATTGLWENSQDLTYLTKSQADTYYLTLDQTTPQTTVGTFTFPNGVFGLNVNSSSMLAVGNSPLTYQSGYEGIDIGITGANAILKVGQDNTHQLQFVWLYNADPALASCHLNTYGYANPLTIRASALTFQGSSVSVIGTTNIDSLTASKLVFTDASKNLTSTGIGASGQFIKGDGSLDSTAYLSSLGATTGATSQSQVFTLGATLSNMTAGSVLFAGTAGVISQDNSNFSYDATNHRLSVGGATASASLNVRPQTIGGVQYFNMYLAPMGEFNSNQLSIATSLGAGAIWVGPAFYGGANAAPYGFWMYDGVDFNKMNLWKEGPSYQGVYYDEGSAGIGINYFGGIDSTIQTPFAVKNKLLFGNGSINAGTVSITSGSTAVTGSGTQFTKQFSTTTTRGNKIYPTGGHFLGYTISSITDDTHIVLSAAPVVSLTNVTFGGSKVLLGSGQAYTTYTQAGDVNLLYFLGRNVSKTVASVPSADEIIYTATFGATSTDFYNKNASATVSFYQTGYGGIASDILTLVPYHTVAGGALSRVLINSDLTLDDGVNTLQVNGSIGLNLAQTTTNGLTGTAVSNQPFQGSAYKKFVVYLTNFTSAGTVLTFPTAFINAPYVYGDAAAIAIAVTNTTTVTLTSVGAVAGNIFIEGY
jgi:hypothetical protein